MALSDAKGARTAIVLLHGIGDQRQRETLTRFQGALARMGLTSTNRQKILREPEAQDDTFTYFVAEEDISGKPSTLAEFYWADLSRVRLGLFSILRNFFQLIIDAPDIIYACLGPRLIDDQPRDYFVLRCMRALLALMMWLICFPIVAINIAYAILVAEFAIHVVRVPSVTLDTVADTNFAVLSLVSIVVLAVPTLQRRWRSYTRAILAMAMATMAAVAVASFYHLFVADQGLTYGVYARVLNEALNGLWLIVILISLLYLLALPLLTIFFWRRWRALLLGFATTFLVIRFWLVLITTLWLVYITSIFEAETYDSLIANIGGPLRFVSLLWFDVAIVGLVLLSALVSYIAQTMRNRPRITGQKYPRLIVPGALPFIALTLAVVGVGIIGYCGCAEFFEACSAVQCRFVFTPTEWIIANAATLLAVGGLVIQFSHSGFEVAIDIVNYFKSERGHRSVNPFGAIVSAFRYVPDDVLEFRSRLRNRLRGLMRDLNEAFGPFERTVMIGHSLGTMIAIDVLSDTREDSKPAGKIELVTLGSPYTAVFGYYFPHMFAPAGAGLLASVGRWTNIYRENDYVGTNLTNGDSGVIEIAQPPFGHLEYFADDGVMREIADFLDEKEAT